MNERGSATAGGTSIVTLLQVAFVVLKLCKVINWSWIWVLAPTWISTLFGVGILLVVFIIYWKNGR